MQHTQGGGTGHWRYDLTAQSQLPARPTRAQRLAWALRRWADRVDGGTSLRLTWHSRPKLTRAVVLQCLDAGLDNTSQLMASELQHIPEEHTLRREYPELYAHAETSRSP